MLKVDTLPRTPESGTRIMVKSSRRIVAVHAHNVLLQQCLGRIPMGDSQHVVNEESFMLLKELRQRAGYHEDLEDWSPRMREYAKQYGIRTPKRKVTTNPS